MTNNNSKPMSGKAIFYSISIGVILSFVLAKACASATSSDENSIGINEAYIISKDFVDDNLKAPSSSNFTGNYSYDDLGGNEFQIKSEVDSENSFGASLREKWTVKLKYNGGEWTDKNNWTLESIQID